MVLMISEIWLTDTPSIAGPICLITRIAPASLKLMRGRTSMPIFSGAEAGKQAVTPRRRSRPSQRQHRWVKMRRGEQRKANHADIKERGAKAGTEKRFRYSGWHPPATPAKSAEYGEGYPQQLRRQGKFIRRVGKARCRYHDYPGAASMPRRSRSPAPASVNRKRKPQRRGWHLRPACFYIPQGSGQMPVRKPLRQKYGAAGSAA